MAPRPIRAPISFASAEEMADWREHVAWPVSYRESYETGRRIMAALHHSIVSLTDETARAAVLLAGGQIAGSVLSIPELASALAAEGTHGI